MQFTIKVEPSHHDAVERALSEWGENYDDMTQNWGNIFNPNQHFEYDKNAGVLAYSGERHPLQGDGGLAVVWAALNNEKPVPRVFARTHPAKDRHQVMTFLVNITPDGEQWVNDCLAALKNPDRFQENGQANPQSTLHKVCAQLDERISSEAFLGTECAHRIREDIVFTVSCASRHGGTLAEILTSSTAGNAIKETLMRAAMQASAVMPDPRITMQETTFGKLSMPMFGTLDDVRRGDLFYEASKDNPVFAAQLAYKALSDTNYKLSNVEYELSQGRVALAGNVLFYAPDGETPHDVCERVSRLRQDDAANVSYRDEIVADAFINTTHIPVSRSIVIAALEPSPESAVGNTHFDPVFERNIRRWKDVPDDAWLDDRPGYIAGGDLTTDVPEHAIRVVDTEENVVPETGEVHVYETWECSDDPVCEVRHALQPPDWAVDAVEALRRHVDDLLEYEDIDEATGKTQEAQYQREKTIALQTLENCNDVMTYIANESQKLVELATSIDERLENANQLEVTP